MPHEDDSERSEVSSSQPPAGSERDASPTAASYRSTSEEIATDGLFIASATTRLALKNRIVIDTLAGNVDFSVDAYIDAAREALRSLADEAEAEFVRLEAVMTKARRRDRQAKSSHDDQQADLENLLRRREQTSSVGHMLRERIKEVVRIDLPKLKKDARRLQKTRARWAADNERSDAPDGGFSGDLWERIRGR